MRGSSSSCRTFLVATLIAVGLSGAPLTASGESPANAANETASESESLAGASERSGNSESNPIWWLYISGLGLAILVPAGFFLYRRYGTKETYEFGEEEFRPEGAPTEQPGFVEGKSSEGGLSAPEKAFFSVEESSPSETTAQMAISQSGGAKRMCPECGEQFPASVVLCPYDSTPLQNIDDQPQVSTSDQTVLERQRCPGCGRRYEAGPDYCYHDGMRLRQDTVEEAEEAPTFKACETCGWEGDSDARLCPHDGSELTAVSPAEDDRVSPPVPVLVCPECDTFAQPGRAKCPEDGAVLTPLQNAQVAQLPERGFGPSRKICEECGETFSKGASYCAFDGSELVPMN